MKKIIIGFTIFVLTFFAVASRAVAGGDEEKAIADVVTAAISAQNEFTSTKDVDSVMKHYHPQLISISNETNEEGGYAEMKDALTTMRDGAYVSSGILGVSLSIGNISAHVSGDFGWAVFDGIVLASLRGGLNASNSYVCTNVLKKTEGKWLIIQEHCSFYTKNG